MRSFFCIQPGRAPLQVIYVVNSLLTSTIPPNSHREFLTTVMRGACLARGLSRACELKSTPYVAGEYKSSLSFPPNLYVLYACKTPSSVNYPDVIPTCHLQTHDQIALPRFECWSKNLSAPFCLFAKSNADLLLAGYKCLKQNLKRIIMLLISCILLLE